MRRFELLLFVAMLIPASSLADHATQLTSGPAWDYYPRWSHDGGTISFTSNRTGAPGIFLIPSSGGKPVHLPTGLQGDHHTTWSPDGTLIMFDAYYDNVPDIWTIPITGGNPTRITTTTYGDAHPNWNVRLNRIAYSALGIRTMKPDGTDVRTVASNGWHPSWAPDGSKIAYVSEGTGDSEIWIVPSNGGTPVRFTNNPASDEQPNWSPDGRWIIFMSDRGGNRDIWIAPVNGGEPKRITDNAANDWYPCISPDQTKIVFTSNRAGNLDLWIIDSGLPAYQTGFHDVRARETVEPGDHGVGTLLRGHSGDDFDGR